MPTTNLPWSPKLQPPGWGWWPVLCYPWVAHGSGVCCVANIETGQEFQLRPDVRCQAGGFLDANTLLYMTGEQGANVYTFDLTTQISSLLCEDIDISRAPSAGHGHWGGGYAGTKDCTYDGILLDANIGWYMAANGAWACVKNEAANEMAVYKAGVYQRSVPLLTTSVQPAVDAGGYCTYGYNGPVYLINCADGTQIDVTCTPWRKESGSAPLTVNGAVWVGSTSESPAGCVLLRPAGSLEVIQADAPAPSGMVWQTYEDQFVFATYNGGGNLFVNAVAQNALRKVLQPLPEMLDPVGTITAVPVSGSNPLTVTTTLTLTQGATQAIRFYGVQGSDAPVRWSGPTGNDAIAQGILSKAGGWSLWARMQGLNGTVRDTPHVPVSVEDTPPAVQPWQGINAGFGEPLPDDRLAYFVSQGVTCVRTWIGTPANAPIVIQQLQKFETLSPLYIVKGSTNAEVMAQLALVPDGSRVELGNEPNIGTEGVKMTPGQYAGLATFTRDYCLARGLVVYYGSVSNCNRDGQAWLKAVLDAAPWIDRVSVHRYPYTPDQNPALSPYGSRTQEMAALRSVLTTGRTLPRRVRVTEIGCKCGPKVYQTGWWIFKQWHAVSQELQLYYLTQEYQYWRFGLLSDAVDGVDAYQENSENANDYGFNALDGSHRLAWQWYTR